MGTVQESWTLKPVPPKGGEDKELPNALIIRRRRQVIRGYKLYSSLTANTG